jgi:hypothetical protein
VLAAYAANAPKKVCTRGALLYTFAPEATGPSFIHAFRRALYRSSIGGCAEAFAARSPSRVGPSIAFAERRKLAHLVTVGFVGRHLIFDFIARVHHGSMIFLRELAGDLR